MKKFIALIMLLLPIGAMAAVPELDKIVEDYSSTEGVTVVNLTGEMLKAQASVSVGEANKYLEGIESLNILQSDNADHSKKIVKRIDKVLKGSELESLLDIQPEGDNRVRILANRDGETISDIVIYVTEGSEVALIMFSGTLDPSMLGEMQGAIGALNN